jgi:energy-coupling factor transporter ATP-binding protein EcfA2
MPPTARAKSPAKRAKSNATRAESSAAEAVHAVSSLQIRNFAHLANVNIEFGDLTILVGPQGTGKSLALQWLKTAIDGKQIVSALRAAGQDGTKPEILVDLIFGVGMGYAWKKDATSIVFDDKPIRLQHIDSFGDGQERVFFIPAHRAMLISDGWAAPFQKLTAETPVVARLFSQNLFDRFSAREGDKLFPLDRVLKKQYRILIDDAVFHGGKVGVEQDLQHAKRLKLTHGEARLPFMTWTAGQREFTPLLLGLYHLLPSRQILKQPGIDWVIIEEPEMGLHPQAVTVFMLLVLELLWRGYRVVLSTHSPLVLTVVWMLRRLAETEARWQLVCEAFGIGKGRQQPLKAVAETVLRKQFRTHLLSFRKDGLVSSKDISTLDPGSDDDDVAGWGGLAGFGSNFGDAVRKAANEAAQ